MRQRALFALMLPRWSSFVRKTFAPAFDTLNGRAEALYPIGDALANVQGMRIMTFALVARLPTMCVQRDYVEMGGLRPYEANYPDLNRRAADLVDKILRGAKPADLPVEQPAVG